MKVQINLTLEQEVVEEIDAMKGLASRSAVVNDMLKKQLRQMEAKEHFT